MIKNIYFKGLDGLRFLAAFAVILHHAEILKVDYDVSNRTLYRYFIEIGPIAVTFFFVLSGFLITNILLTEKINTNNINIYNFFIKRVLRILPLYYLLTILSFLILPNIDFFNQPYFSLKLYHDFALKFIMYLSMQPHLIFILFPQEPVPYGVVAWSIGVEEHFYLLWPLFIKFCNSHFFVFLTIIFIFSSTILFVNNFSLPFTSAIFLDIIVKLFDTLRFSCMAIGGIFALLYIKKHNLLKILMSKYIEVLVICLLFIIFSFGFPFLFFKHEVYSLLFSILILNIATNNKSIFSNVVKFILEHKSIKFLGIRSYGIYMFHMIAIQIAMKLTLFLFDNEIFSLLNNLFYYILIFLFTFIFTIVSYNYIEIPILKLKYNFIK
jgi:peptidoglycan/LPS O-acetylase OafA/YrhL